MCLALCATGAWHHWRVLVAREGLALVPVTILRLLGREAGPDESWPPGKEYAREAL